MIHKLITSLTNDHVKAVGTIHDAKYRSKLQEFIAKVSVQSLHH